jgi:hypothetical protein
MDMGLLVEINTIKNHPYNITHKTRKHSRQHKLPPAQRKRLCVPIHSPRRYSDVGGEAGNTRGVDLNQ